MIPAFPRVAAFSLLKQVKFLKVFLITKYACMESKNSRHFFSLVETKEFTCVKLAKSLGIHWITVYYILITWGNGIYQAFVVPDYSQKKCISPVGAAQRQTFYLDAGGPAFCPYWPQWWAGGRPSIVPKIRLCYDWNDMLKFDSIPQPMKVFTQWYFLVVEDF